MSEPVAAGPKRRKTPRWVWAALLLSLAANLFVVGFVARAVVPNRFAAANAGGIVGHLLEYSQELTSERRKEIRAGFGSDRPNLALRPLRQELRAARIESLRTFRSDPFKREEFLAAEARVIAAEMKLRETAAQIAAAAAARMTTEERASFVKWRAKRRQAGANSQVDRDSDSEGAGKKAAE
jgi:Spy/CpxP family protein refolding chaperone